MAKHKQTVLTGDRPTGKLHLGHFVGSLKNRLILQEKYPMFILVADLHALTTNTDTSQIAENVKNLILDQLAIGLDPKKVVFCGQSQIPEDAELAIIFSMLVSKPTVERVPTLKEMLRDLKIENPSLGLINYPVLQAADILMVKGSLVPVGKDQASHIELAREIAARFNSLYGEVFPIPEPLIPKDTGTLPGLDGKAKMSKSLGNAIFLSDDPKTVSEKVMQMYTDPGHIHASDPGKVEGNVVFTYLDIFDLDKKEVEKLKADYRQGGLGDVVIKKRLIEVLNKILAPIRERRKELEKNPKAIMKILEDGTKKAREVAKETLSEVKKAMKINYFD
ncbi:MAG TPA: tryptophan--tRNA ligase [Candidatus Paceibacterota bacterium]|nr:tryptophan--tRNA ligase [Candidatus Paceibacterota bacterium]